LQIPRAHPERLLPLIPLLLLLLLADQASPQLLHAFVPPFRAAACHQVLYDGSPRQLHIHNTEALKV
jgi:hypothetical protein